MKESWKDIVGYEGIYEISNAGIIKSIKNNKNKKEKTLKHFVDNNYHRVCLCKNGHKKRFMVHRLVAEAFIPNPNNYPEVNHKDENKENNYVGNLEWCNKKYNMNYGTQKERSRLKNIETQKNPIFQMDKYGNIIKLWKSANRAQKEGGFKASSILKCVNKMAKTHDGFIWIYEKDYKLDRYKSNK